ncbi:hypothetical protein VNO78_11699 [Psophocarpus tetragonolobus]|uniref:ATP-dependent DNA helicase n=1 Tax=Psophocarpus tetragonolobus TaxID=3891 RepID=A0AAN9SPR8_PSOTE
MTMRQDQVIGMHPTFHKVAILNEQDFRPLMSIRQDRVMCMHQTFHKVAILNEQDFRPLMSIRQDRVMCMHQTFHKVAILNEQDFQPLMSMMQDRVMCMHPTFHKSRDTCCSGGKVSFSNVSVPIELLEIFSVASSEGKHFRQHIRSYNHVLSFTSLGVHIDENMIATGRGIYSFRAQGAIYHNIQGFYPNKGFRPRFLQLYIYDTEHELQNRMLENPQLHQTLVYKLQQILHRYNPFVHVFRQLALREDVDQCSLLIKECPANQPQYNLPTGPQVAVIIVGGDVESMTRGRDINVVCHDENLMRIQETVGYYDFYNILCCYLLGRTVGTLTQKTIMVKVSLAENITVTCFRYVLMINLYYYKRDDSYNNIETTTENVGHRTILPSSFISSRRDLTQCYEDDLLARIFKAKFEQLKEDVINKGVLGKVKSYMYVTEFQKRGLPHVHMLLILESNEKLRDPEDYDSIVRAEIPKIEEEPQLYAIVLKHMIHGPCRTSNPRSLCMKNGKCNKRYPKEFLDDTRQEIHELDVICIERFQSIIVGIKEIRNGTQEDAENTAIPRVIQEELAIQVPNEDVDSIQKLNHDQSIAFNAIMDVINSKQSQVFFVDGPGGTGKTFLYCALIAQLRGQHKIVLATASSGIVAILLLGGRTAHSRFKIPIYVEPESFCSISRQSDLAKLIRQTTTIIWDEVPMINRYALEALDRSLRDLLDLDSPFGGKVMILGGDFRQVLPVFQKGTRAQMILACIVKSPLWAITKVLHLRQNMRSLQDPTFAEYLMRIGDGTEPTKYDDMVKIPHQLAITWEGESSIQKLIQETFPQLESHTWDATYMV